MNKTQKKHTLSQRIWAFLLALVMVVGYIPTPATAQDSRAVADVPKVSDAETHNRLNDFYGSDTYHSGKVTVDKSVSSDSMVVDGTTFSPSSNENFIVTVSQAAQVMALTTEMDTPVDVVFVLDTSGSMYEEGEGNAADIDRVTPMVNAANSAIATLMAANEQNRVGVVAFSSAAEWWDNQWSDWGGGTANEAAANVLSQLSHYTGTAATAHLQMVNSNGSATGNGSKDYIAGRDTVTVGNGNNQRTVNAYRNGSNGGTNIQAGIALGAQMLTNATTTAVVDGRTVTRIPFLIVLSDGQPTYTHSEEAWYNPTSNNQKGPGSSSYAGNGFLPALTAAYYKGKITEHYFGTEASADNRCFVYTIGVQVDSLTGNDAALAQITLNPKEHFKADSSNTYYSTFNNYWTNYTRNNPSDFRIHVNGTDNNNNNYYTVTANTITATKNAVMGLRDDGSSLGYAGGLAYNDGYYNATQTSQIAGIFEQIVSEIAQKSISSPTQVNTTEEFDGYVTFTDVIGEYMEVKDMKGLLADGNFYQGKYVSQNLGANGTDAEFDASLLNVLATRLTMTASSGVTAAGLVNAAITNNTYNGEKTQAYYNSDDDYDNSIVWWGKTYTTDDNFEQGVQVLGHAVDDSIAYIEEAKANNAVPAGADVVCRSYFFYGTAGGTVADPNHDYLYFVIRVQRSLVAPYQQTVVISAPASLLSMEKVYITEDKTGDTTTYTAKVEEAIPARVVYEVGLRSDINEYNVEQIVGADTAYTGETGNYANGQYYFYTNDWDRSDSATAHERAMSKATFYAADNNPYYTYQENTYLYDASGNILNGATAPTDDAYYYRDVYTWGTEKNSDGELIATKSRKLVKVNVPANAGIQNDGTGWYIPAGAYTAAVISPDEQEEIAKNPNATQSAEVVAHPHRTGDSGDAHYTVYLGNNGRLTMTSAKSKFVDVTKAGTTTIITDANGNAVMVGDTLTYRVNVANTGDEDVTATVTDMIPAGTIYVDGSAKVLTASGTEVTATVTVADGKITWTGFTVPANTTYVATFSVVVDESALSGQKVVEDIENTASIQLGNNPAYNTNTVHNPPEGKKLVDTNGDEFNEGETVKVGDELVYRIRYANDSDSEATVTITDVIPKGTTYVDGSASHDGVYDAAAKTITWTITGVDAHTSGIVSFRVIVDASAKADWTEGATQPADTLIKIPNQATIQIGTNDPRYTNIPTINVTVGALTLSKVVTSGDATETFTLILTETESKLDGIYKLTSTKNGDRTVEFVNGTASVTISKDETITIYGLPAGAVLTLSEDLTGKNGWTAAYDKTTLTIVNGTTEIAGATVTNTYTAQPVEFQLKGTKNVEGANFPDGNFTFRATLADEDGNIITGENARQVTATATITDGQNAVFAFSPRTFNAKQTLYYLIDEVPSALPGVTSATNQYLVKLVISDEDSQLVATTYYKTRANASADWSADWTEFAWKADETITSDTLVFTNSYAPKETSVTISGTKKLTGRTLKENEFSFQLVEPGKQPSEGTVIGTATNDKNGYFSFPAITYTAADTYTYYIREVVGSLAHVDYDRSYYKVEVTITDVNGQLTNDANADDKADIVITKYAIKDDGTYDVENAKIVDAIAYTNTYHTQDTQVTLSGVKTLSGAAANGLNAEDFSFEVIQVEGDDEGNITIQDGKYVPVQENGADKIVASAGNAADTDGADSNGDYSGTITFSPINYSRNMLADNETEKYFYYIVKEVVPASTEPSYDVNMKYDTREYKVTVKVTLDADGVLTAKIVKVDDVEMNADTYGALNFENIKNPDTAKVTPEGTKSTTLPNGSTSTQVPAGLSFSFTIVNARDNTEAGVGVSAPTTAGNTTGLTIDFTDLVYDHKDVDNTYYYWIYESNTAAQNGVTYDPARYLMKVIVARDSNNAIAPQVTYYRAGTITSGGEPEDYAIEDNKLNGVTPSFGNTYDADGSLNITALKQVNEGSTNGWRFDFKLVREDVEGSEITGVSDASSGVITFGTMNYSLATEFPSGSGNEKTITYILSEIEPSTAKIPGMTYDKSQYRITVKLTHADGTITVEVVSVTQITDVEGNVLENPVSVMLPEVADGATTVNVGVTFNNTYAVEKGTKADIVANKTLNGRPLNKDEFGFELFRWTGAEEVSVETATNKDGGVITFTRTYPATISRDFFVDTDGDNVRDTATFVYHMKEIDTQMGGIAYSGNDYWIEVVIKHDRNSASLVLQSVTYYEDFNEETGEFVGDPITDTSVVEFVNNYSTNETSFIPEVSKSLLGAEDENGVRKELSQDGYIFSYQVYEVDEDGVIQTTASGSQTVNKVASTGNNAADGTINFSPIGYTTKGTHYYLIREINGNDANITYNPSNAEYYVKVVVTDDGKGTLLVTSVEYGTRLADGNITGSVTDVTFTNYYGPGYVTLDLGLKKTVKIQKPTTDGQIYELKGSEFDFNVYAYVADDTDYSKNPVLTTGTNGATNENGIADITFGSIVITREMVYDGVPTSTPATKAFKYIVLEEEPSDAGSKGIVIDARAILVTVNVTDDGFGNLSYTTSYSYGTRDAEGNYTFGEESAENKRFENTYNAEPAPLKLTATKTLHNKKLTDGEFKFVLTQVEKNITITGITNDADGNISVNLSFTTPGEYTFTLKEVNEDKPGYTYDGTVYTIKVNVTDDGQGKLHANATYYKDYDNAEGANNTPVGGMSFVNSYTPPAIDKDLTLAIDATKAVQNTSGENQTDLLAGFNFKVTDVTGKPVIGADGKEITGVSDKDGKITFSGNFKFETAGEYHYHITETGSKPGYVMDTNTWSVYILVNYNAGPDDVTYTNTAGKEAVAKPGELYIQESNVVTYPVTAASQETDVQAQTEQEPVFVNIYDPEPTSITLKAKKVLEGRPLKDHEFTFHLLEGNLIVAEAKNTADGTIEFTVNYTAPGTHTYVLKEVIPNEKQGVTYDATSYTVVVEVTDVNGELKAEVIGGTAEKDRIFTNTYNAASDVVKFTGTKTLTGKTLEKDEFSFELKDADGKVIETVKNAADGSFAFSEIQYTKAGTYTYTVTEVKGSETGITYDETVYTVTVTVEDDLNGKLVATAAITDKDGKEVAAISFENTYDEPEKPTDPTDPTDPSEPTKPTEPEEPADPPKITVPVTIHKTVINKTLDIMTPEGFKFQILGENGEEMDVVTSNILGVASYSFDFDKEDAGKTFTYTISEVNTGEDGVIYSDASYEIEIEVLLDENLNRLIPVIKVNEIPVLSAVLEFVNINDPEEPSEPSEPTKPTEPEKPTEPSEPSKPTEPEKPTEPSEPTKPTEPEDPTEPGEPTEPEETTKPSEPTKPTDPSKPTDPTKPTKPNKPSDNPQTGDDSGIALWSVTMIGSMLALAVMLLLAMQPKGKYERR